MACFRFKKFSVEQEHCAMKVNTDGVLLGAWMKILPTDNLLLDIGTGSGVIALMVAQRLVEALAQSGGSVAGGEKEITGIDIDAGSIEDSSKNFQQFYSNMPDEVGKVRVKMNSYLCAVQDLPHRFPDKKYDLIFSNPPYFINALKSADDAKSNARHTDMLSQGEIIRSALHLLAPGGRLALILPSVEAEEFVRKINFLADSTKKGEQILQLTRICKVHTLKDKPAKRWMLEFILSENIVGNIEHTRLTIHCDGEYTAEYKKITGDFYLNF